VGFEDFHMTNRFPGPWRITEFPNGFAVYDATDRQLGFFYGRADPNMAGHAGFVMIDDARQIAIDFARLPELLNQTLGRSEAVTFTEDQKFAKVEKNRSPQDARETSRLLGDAGLSVTTVTGSPLTEAPTTVRRFISPEPERRRSPQTLPRPGDPRSIYTKFLVPIALAALPAGYFFFGDSDPPVTVAVVPQVTTSRLPAEFSSLREATAPSSRVTDITVESPIEPEATGSTIQNPVGPKVQTATLHRTVPLDMKPTENGIEARPPQTYPPQKEPSFMPSPDALALPKSQAFGAAEITLMMEKGTALIAMGNIGGARLMFQHAAEAGDPTAAFALAETYDPSELRISGVKGGITSDIALAVSWYEKAKDLGSTVAPERLKNLARVAK
jgi:hypothetical protein